MNDNKNEFKLNAKLADLCDVVDYSAWLCDRKLTDLRFVICHNLTVNTLYCTQVSAQSFYSFHSNKPFLTKAFLPKNFILALYHFHFNTLTFFHSVFKVKRQE